MRACIVSRHRDAAATVGNAAATVGNATATVGDAAATVEDAAATQRDTVVSASPCACAQSRGIGMPVRDLFGLLFFATVGMLLLRYGDAATPVRGWFTW